MTAVLLAVSCLPAMLLPMHANAAPYAYTVTVDEGLHLRVLRLWQTTMAMLTDNTPPHAVTNAKVFPHLLRSLSRIQHRAIGQPLVIGITQQQESTRTNHRTEFVLVVRQAIDAVSVEVLLLTL